MSNYQRLISYIYAYEGGVKGKNIGFAKLETRGNQCRISVSLKRIYVGGNPIGVYLLSGENEIRIGTLFARNSAGEFRTAVNVKNIEGSGCLLEECYGLTIHDTESAWRCYTTIWEDAVAHAAEVDLAGVSAAQLRKQEEKAVRLQMQEKERAEERRRYINKPSADAEDMYTEQHKEKVLPEAVQVEEEKVQKATAELCGEKTLPEEAKIKEEKALEATAKSCEEKALREEAKVKEEKALEVTAESCGEKTLPEEAQVEEEKAQEVTAKSCEKTGLPEAVQLNDKEVLKDFSELPEMKCSPKAEKIQAEIQTEALFEASPECLETELSKIRETEEKSEEEIWKMLCSRYPKILAFDYEGGCEILTIKPQDIGLLPRENWIFGSNSFLLHGYYYYRYLILVRLNQKNGTNRYLLGVPGNYVSNEKYMAAMFGFSEFVLSKKQPRKSSRFGYWYRDIKIR